mmetsp:Transcript_106917/g.297446  ORF Transcript_106917/g.297446 Transcript_106917/m.297446 type:complete len:106 (+) Transcript_106917:177-494(+)
MAAPVSRHELKDEAPEAGGIKGFFTSAYSRITNSRGLNRAWSASKKAGTTVGEYAWIVGATAVVIVVPLLLEMEREATFQLQAEMMQKQVMEMQRSAQPGANVAP